MSTYPGAVLAYGYALGGGESGWYVAEVTKESGYMDLDLDWLGSTADMDSEDVVARMNARLLEKVAGFTEADPLPHSELEKLLNEHTASTVLSDYSATIQARDLAWARVRQTAQYQARNEWRERRRQAEESLNVGIISVGSSEYTEYVLTVREHENHGTREYRQTFPLTVEWAQTNRIDQGMLDTSGNWDLHLQAAVTALGITPVVLTGSPWERDHKRTPVAPGLILGATYR